MTQNSLRSKTWNTASNEIIAKLLIATRWTKKALQNLYFYIFVQYVDGPCYLEYNIEDSCYQMDKRSWLPNLMQKFIRH